MLWAGRGPGLGSQSKGNLRTGRGKWLVKPLATSEETAA